MNLIKPKKLKKGDTISIIAPAGAVDMHLVQKAEEYFKNCGYNVKLGSNINNHYRCMSGSDDERLKDLHIAFSDSETNAIICARGGFGTLKLLNKIDYNLIRNNPKILCGYSDITALSAMILKKCNLITFSGPMAQSDFSCTSSQINKYTEKNFWSTLTNSTPVKLIPQDCAKTYKKGSAAGVMFGGNLATIASLCGQDFIPDNKFIFFTEDINEPAYKIDKYFTQLFSIKKFKENISALILGDFTETDNKQWLDEIFTEIASQTRIPIFSGYPISHTEIKATIPFGAEAVIENSGVMTINNE